MGIVIPSCFHVNSLRAQCDRNVGLLMKRKAGQKKGVNIHVGLEPTHFAPIKSRTAHSFLHVCEEETNTKSDLGRLDINNTKFSYPHLVWGKPLQSEKLYSTQPIKTILISVFEQILKCLFKQSLLTDTHTTELYGVLDDIDDLSFSARNKPALIPIKWRKTFFPTENQIRDAMQPILDTKPLVQRTVSSTRFISPI
ncbi:hypothetical protein YC2023_012925 [Brassica napus]